MAERTHTKNTMDSNSRNATVTLHFYRTSSRVQNVTPTRHGRGGPCYAKHRPHNKDQALVYRSRSGKPIPTPLSPLKPNSIDSCPENAPYDFLGYTTSVSTQSYAHYLLVLHPIQAVETLLLMASHLAHATYLFGRFGGRVSVTRLVGPR